MPHASFKVKPGIDQNETPALNEAGLSTSNLIRFIYDRNGNGLVQKLGGWTKFYGGQFTKSIRAIWPWEDINASTHLAVGTQNGDNDNQAELSVITNGVLQTVTPQTTVSNIAPVVSTTLGSSIVTITDSNVSGINQYDCVYIATQISIGGLVLFGLYRCIPVGGTSYSIQAVDALGNPLLATSTSTSPVLPQISTTAGSNIITVNFNAHGYNVGNTFSILIPITVGGVTFYGEYIIQSVTTNSFTIYSISNPTSGESKYINNDTANYTYNFGIGVTQVGSGYGVGGYGTGGYGFGTTTAPSTLGTPISASNWSLDNWGSYLVSVPLSQSINLTINEATVTTGLATVLIGSSYIIPVGQSVTISGCFPSIWNQTVYVSASGTGYFSFPTTTILVNATATGSAVVNYAPYQPIYLYDPLGSSPISVAIPNAPVYNDGVFVAMPQRQLVTWGSTFTGIPDPLLIRWSDVNNFDSWIGNAVNQAGSYRIPKGSKIVGAMQAPQQGLIFTDLGVWSMQYIGPPYVYSFNEIGTGCGLIARKAAASIAGAVYWMGNSQFFTLSGNGVQPVPCPIWDVIFQDLDTSNLDKIRVGVNSLFGEITWYYPSLSNGGENNAYVKYNVYLQCWDFGTMSRSAWTDQSVLGKPIGADPVSGYLYQHETSNNADGSPMNSFFRTGYFAMSEADVKSFVDEVWPDMKWGFYEGSQIATVNMTFYVTDFAGQAPDVYGPYPMTKNTTWFNPRFRGRLVSIQLSSDDLNSFWRLGNIRYRVQQDGRY